MDQVKKTLKKRNYNPVKIKGSGKQNKHKSTYHQRSEYFF
jgi:hypothetical protein